MAPANTSTGDFDMKNPSLYWRTYMEDYLKNSPVLYGDTNLIPVYDGPASGPEASNVSSRIFQSELLNHPEFHCNFICAVKSVFFRLDELLSKSFVWKQVMNPSSGPETLTKPHGTEVFHTELLNPLDYNCMSAVNHFLFRMQSDPLKTTSAKYWFPNVVESVVGLRTLQEVWEQRAARGGAHFQFPMASGVEDLRCTVQSSQRRSDLQVLPKILLQNFLRGAGVVRHAPRLMLAAPPTPELNVYLVRPPMGRAPAPSRQSSRRGVPQADRDSFLGKLDWILNQMGVPMPTGFSRVWFTLVMATLASQAWTEIVGRCNQLHRSLTSEDYMDTEMELEDSLVLRLLRDEFFF